MRFSGEHGESTLSRVLPLVTGDCCLRHVSRPEALPCRAGCTMVLCSSLQSVDPAAMQHLPARWASLFEASFRVRSCAGRLVRSVCSSDEQEMSTVWWLEIRLRVHQRYGRQHKIYTRRFSTPGTYSCLPVSYLIPILMLPLLVWLPSAKQNCVESTGFWLFFVCCRSHRLYLTRFEWTSRHHSISITAAYDEHTQKSHHPPCRNRLLLIRKPG